MDVVRGVRTDMWMKVSAAAAGLKRLREQSKMSVREVADALGRPASTYASYEDKYKKPYLPLDLVHALVPIFKARGVDKASILALAGITADAPKLSAQPNVNSPTNETIKSLSPVPIVRSEDRFIEVKGLVECGPDGWALFNGETVDVVPRPANLAGVPNAYAVFVTGDSMEFRYLPSEIAFVHPGKPVTPGCFVIVQMQPTEGEAPRAFLKRLVKRTGDRVIVEQFNPPKKFNLAASDILSIHRVVGSSEA